MAEEICSEVVCTYFEDAECGPDPMHPRDTECRSAENDDSSDDDEIEELCVDPAVPARGRVPNVERGEVVIGSTSAG